jgi:hypothetical protein
MRGKKSAAVSFQTALTGSNAIQCAPLVVERRLNYQFNARRPVFDLEL